MVNKRISTPGRVALLFLATLFAVAAVWRAILAVQHYRLSLAVVDDPSIRELEQLGAFLEAGLCLVLLVHAALLVFYSRRPLIIFWPFVAVTGLLCASVIAGTFAGLPLLNLTGVSAIAIVAGVAIACVLMRFNWASLYSGALPGSTLGWLLTTPAVDVFAGLFVVGPAVVYAFLGAALAGGLGKWRQRSGSV